MNNQIKNIGWIGTGVMGLSMCKHLLKAGYNLKVFNRTQAKAQPLIDIGALYVTPKELAQTSDIVFVMVGYPKDVEDTILGVDGVLEHMRPNSFLVDHTTSSPQLAELIFKRAQERQVHSIDAPVSGGDIGAREARLVVMCGGEAHSLDQVRDVMKNYSTNIQLNGGAGKGQHTKMANQIILAGNMMGTVEGLIYGKKVGLDLQQLIDTIKSGAANSAAWSVLGQRMVNGDMNPGFYVEHYVKDLEIALEEARRVNLCLPGMALVRQFYASLMAHGKGRLGSQSLILTLEQLNNFSIGDKLQQ